MEIKKIIEISELQKSTIQQIEKRRFLYDKIANSKGKHLVGLVGPRGVGKTIMLK